MAEADDLSGSGKMSNLKEWYGGGRGGLMNVNGPVTGYTTNAAKVSLYCKPERYDSALEPSVAAG